MISMNREGYFTMVQACRELNILQNKCNILIKEGKLKCERKNRRVWIKKEWLDQYIAKYGRPEPSRTIGRKYR